MPFVDLRGVRLFFTDEGAGRPLAFVHGFSCDCHDWSWQLPHFRTSHRLIAIDLRGHGRSSAPEHGYEVASLAADVAALLDHLGCGPVIALGHSLGGAIAASVAVERPQQVRAVVAIDPGHLLPDETAPGLATALVAYEEGDPAVVAPKAFDQLSHVAGTAPWLATWHDRRAAGVPEHVLRQTMRGLIGGKAPFILRSNSGPYLARIQCPVLSFYVDPDRAAVATSVFSRPPSKTVCFEGSGHWLHQERAAEVNALIEAWVAMLPPD